MKKKEKLGKLKKKSNFEKKIEKKTKKKLAKKKCGVRIIVNYCCNPQ
jgi:hypothetical protein